MDTRKLLFAFLALVGASLACNINAPQESVPPTLVAPNPPAVQAPSQPPPPTVAVEKEISAVLDTADTGSICPTISTSVDNGDPPSIIGEKNDAYECEGFWTYDIQGIPFSASILSATLMPGTCTVNGTPFSYSDLYFELVDFGHLDVSDYGNGGIGNFQGGVGYVSWKNCSITGMDVTNHVNTQLKKGAKVIQVRAYFTSGNFSNGVDDYVSFRNGSVPSLVIRYK